MANVTFDCSLTCTSDAHLWVNEGEVNLDESGLTKTGQFTAQTRATLTLRATLEGVKSSAWSLDITPECPGSQPQKLWTRSGTFKKGGISLSGTGKVPDNPCASKDGLELAYEVLPEEKAATATKVPKKVTKRAAKKSSKKSSKRSE